MSGPVVTLWHFSVPAAPGTRSRVHACVPAMLEMQAWARLIENSQLWEQGAQRHGAWVVDGLHCHCVPVDRIVSWEGWPRVD